MALEVGDPIVAAGFAGTSVASGVVGNTLVFGCGTGTWLFNSGNIANSPNTSAREVAPGTSGLFGKDVQVVGQGPQMRGAVIAELQAELGTTGGTGALTECVLVQAANGFRFLVLASSVEEVA